MDRRRRWNGFSANGLEDVYVIEVKNTVDGVATEIDLYYSEGTAYW